MQFSFSSFSTILSELSALPGYLRSRVSTAVLYPFGIVVLTLSAMLGYALGWDSVQTFWDGISLWPKAILTAVTVIGFFFLAYILSSFQGIVSRGFQGEWPNWLLHSFLVRKQIRQQQYEWQQRYEESERLQKVYQSLKTILDTFDPDLQPPLSRQTIRTAQLLPPYHIVAAEDLALAKAAEDETPIPISAVLGRMTHQLLPAGSRILPEQLAALPHPIWLHGMALIPLGLTRAAVPLGLAPGDVVGIYRVSRGEQPLNPGGWLVVNVQPHSAASQSSDHEIVMLTLAAPPEAMAELAPYALGKDVLVSRRPILGPPRLWGAVTRTRRWLPIDPATSVLPATDASDSGTAPAMPQPGDVLDIVYPNLAFRLVQACFLEQIDGGWVVAVTTDDAAQIPLLARLRQSQPVVQRSVVSVPAFTAPIPAYSLTLRADTTVPGQVIAGRFHWKSGSADAVVQAQQELVERFPTEEIAADMPILRSQLNDPAAYQGIVDLRVGWHLGEVSKVHLVYGAQVFDQRRVVIFNCPVVRSGLVRRLLVPKAHVTAINEANVMYVLAAYPVPADWRIWPNARHVIYPADTLNLDLYDEGIPVGCIVQRWTDGKPRIEDFSATTGIIFKPYPQLPKLCSLLVDQSRADSASLPSEGRLEALLLYREHEVNALNELSWTFTSAASPELLSDDDLIVLRQAGLKARVLTALETPHDAAAHRVNATLSVCVRTFRELLWREQREAEYRSTEARKRFRLYYPAEQVALAPTAIGNVLRAVNSYCDELYGLDTALVLPRLSALMSDEMSQKVSAAKEKLDLLEWSWIGTIVVGVGGFLIAVLGGKPRLGLVTLAPALPIGWMILNAAKSAAIGYAEVLRLAFDRERGKVFEMLGLKLDAETNQKQERKLWLAVGQWWLDGSLPDDYRYLLTDTKESA